jgi:opacity protein-like surface antigen
MYVGFLAQKNFSTSSINMDEDAYWVNAIKSAYNDDLDRMDRDQYQAQLAAQGQVWYFLGFPKDYFNLLLINAPSKLYDRQEDDYQSKIVLGAYLFRFDSVLIASEICIGASSLKLSDNVTVNLFKGDVPQKMLEEMEKTNGSGDYLLFESTKYSAIKAESAQQMYWDGTIDLRQRVAFEKGMTYGINFRVGSIVKNRAYAFVIIGAEVDCIKVNSADVGVDNSGLQLIYCTDSYQGPNSNWKVESLATSRDLKENLLEFNESKHTIGVVCGLGAEFFVSRKISVRAQAQYVYHSDTKFTSTDGAGNLKFSSAGLQINGGIFWRF